MSTMNARTLECSDIDQYLGKPMDSSPIREPVTDYFMSHDEMLRSSLRLIAASLPTP